MHHLEAVTVLGASGFVIGFGLVLGARLARWICDRLLS
jgi:hypothetical protein